MKTVRQENHVLWSSYFPELDQNEDAAIQRIVNSLRCLEFPAQQQVSSFGSVCRDYILVIDGSIRVQVVTEKGREVILYHVRSGEGCVLTTSCLLGNTVFPAEGVTKSATTVLAIPAVEFDLALGASSRFRHFVFDNFSQRLSSILSRIEQLCSPSIDRYLAATLLELSDNNALPITATHQEIASELGTVREVVSRHLKRFEMNGWVSLGRGSIEVLAVDRLSALAYPAGLSSSSNF